MNRVMLRHALCILGLLSFSESAWSDSLNLLLKHEISQIPDSFLKVCNGSAQARSSGGGARLILEDDSACLASKKAALENWDSNQNAPRFRALPSGSDSSIKVKKLLDQPQYRGQVFATGLEGCSCILITGALADTFTNDLLGIIPPPIRKR